MYFAGHLFYDTQQRRSRDAVQCNQRLPPILRVWIDRGRVLYDYWRRRILWYLCRSSADLSTAYVIQNVHC